MLTSHLLKVSFSYLSAGFINMSIKGYVNAGLSLALSLVSEHGKDKSDINVMSSYETKLQSAFRNTS
jgi:hypothetical protein